MSRTVALLTGMTLSLTLAGCGQTSDAPPAAAPTVPVDVAAATTSGPAPTATPTVDTATPTGPATPEPSATPDDEPADDRETRDEPTDEGPTASDSVGYAEELLGAWAVQDEDRVERLAVTEVALGTTAWSTDGAWEYERDQDLEWVMPGAGLHAVWFNHPQGGRAVVTVDTGALGGEDAVVGLDFYRGRETDDVFVRTEGHPVNDYADAFYEALLTQDAPALERYGSADVAEAALRDYDPSTWGSVIRSNGFLAFRDEPLVQLYWYPDATNEASPTNRYTQLLYLDVATVLDGADHAVTRLNIHTDERWV